SERAESPVPEGSPPPPPPPSRPCSRSAGGTGVRARARPFFSQRRDKARLAERAPAGRSLVVVVVLGCAVERGRRAFVRPDSAAAVSP
ncbi:unnamed protein product, partial [Ixodes pacificus]